MNNYFNEYFDNMMHKVQSVDHLMLKCAVDKIKDVSLNNSKIIIAGNGGSASIASHVAVDFTKSAGIRAITFNEANLITCLSNDFGYENWIEKAIELYANPDDLVILISSSGKSMNILNGVKKAQDMGLFTITLSGFSPDNQLRKIGDLNFWVDSRSYNFVEMTHHIWLVAIVDHIIESL